MAQRATHGWMKMRGHTNVRLSFGYFHISYPWPKKGHIEADENSGPCTNYTNVCLIYGYFHFSGHGPEGPPMDHENDAVVRTTVRFAAIFILAIMARRATHGWMKIDGLSSVTSSSLGAIEARTSAGRGSLGNPGLLLRARILDSSD